MSTFLQFSACFLALLTTQSSALVDNSHPSPFMDPALSQEVKSLRGEVESLRSQIMGLQSIHGELRALEHGLKIRLQDQLGKLSASGNNLSPRLLARTKTMGFLAPDMSPWDALGEYLDQLLTSQKSENLDVTDRLGKLERSTQELKDQMPHTDSHPGKYEKRFEALEKEIRELKNQNSYMTSLLVNTHDGKRKDRK